MNDLLSNETYNQLQAMDMSALFNFMQLSKTTLHDKMQDELNDYLHELSEEFKVLQVQDYSDYLDNLWMASDPRFHGPDFE